MISRKTKTFTIIVVSLVVFIVGILYAIVGSISLFNYASFSLISELCSRTNYTVGSVMLLISGILATGVGFYGTFTSLNHELKNEYKIAAALMVVLGLGLTAGSIVSYWQYECYFTLSDDFTCSVRTKYGRQNNFTEFVDKVHKEFKCCGSSSYFDFVGSYWWWKYGNYKYAVPKSCCNDSTEFNNCNLGVNNGADIIIKDAINTQGCSPAMKRLINGKVDLFCGVSFGLSFVLFICLLAILLLAREEATNENKDTSSESSISSAKSEIPSYLLVMKQVVEPSPNPTPPPKGNPRHVVLREIQDKPVELLSGTVTIC